MTNFAITIDQLQEDKQGPKQKARVSDLWVSLCPRPWEKPTGQYWSSIGAVGQGWRLNKADVLCVSRRVDVTPPQMQCIFTAGQVAALCRVGLEQRSTYSLHQQQKPKNSGRDGVNAVKEQIINPGDSAHGYQGVLRFFGGFTCSLLCMCRVGDTTLYLKELALHTYNYTLTVYRICCQTETCKFMHFHTPTYLTFSQQRSSQSRMMPLGCSGCGQDSVKLFMVELIWCMMGTMEGAVGHRKSNTKSIHFYNNLFSPN